MLKSSRKWLKHCIFVRFFSTFNATFFLQGNVFFDAVFLFLSRKSSEKFLCTTNLFCQKKKLPLNAPFFGHFRSRLQAPPIMASVLLLSSKFNKTDFYRLHFVVRTASASFPQNHFCKRRCIGTIRNTSASS